METGQPIEQERSLKIVQVKFTKSDGNLIRYEIFNSNGEPVMCELTFYGGPHPDLIDAMNAMLPSVVAVMGLSDEVWTEGNSKVTGIKLVHGAMSEMGFMATVQRAMDNLEATALVNTPVLPPDRCTSDDHRLLGVLHAEACACVRGKRAQMDLFSHAQD